MSRVTSLRKKSLQLKMEKDRRRASHALLRKRNKRPVTLPKNIGKMTPKRRAAA
jgi:hypothetical protein